MSEATLLAAIRANPEGDAPRLEYANWLDTQKDAERAEFIRVQCRLASLSPGDAEWPELQGREEELAARLKPRLKKLAPAEPRGFLFGDQILPDQRYGTRCSTLVITERVNKRLVTHVLERSFNPGPGLALLRRSVLKDWPPRYTEGLKAAAAEVEGVSESTVEESNAAVLAATPVKAQRARGLLKPIKPRR